MVSSPMGRVTNTSAAAENEPASSKDEDFLEQKDLDNLLKRRFFFAPSFEIHGSKAGLYDFGPNGCAIKNELENHWRRHFVKEEGLFEISGPCLTPHSVLKASGHVDRFLDYMVEDVVTKEHYRCDKLIEEALEKQLNPSAKDKKPANAQKLQTVLSKVGGMTRDQLAETIRLYNIKSPANNDVTDPYPFNLMFSTKIGPKKTAAGDSSDIAYLRPETAQGIFVNFKRLLEQNGGKIPFGAACVGTAFRNEIAPRNGLLRVREFPMAEIEYFCDPTQKSPFSKFASVRDLEIPLFPRDVQEQGGTVASWNLGEAVFKGVIENETLGYFIGRTYLFLQSLGINIKKLRFRQHLSTEMAHYASDCWDAEILTTYKWIECVGIADRSAYDLIQHSKATGEKLHASRSLEKPTTVHVLQPKIDRKVLGQTFRNKSKEVESSIEAMTEEQKTKCKNLFESGKEYQILSACSSSSNEEELFTINNKMVD